MNRIDRIFTNLRAEKRRALMPFLCAGRPPMDLLPELLQSLETAGASIVEIGIPYSDPIADGPVIAAAMHRALQSGVTPREVFSAVSRARAGVGMGLVAMVSISIVHRIGIDAFCSEASAAGFDGLIVPDAPLGEAAPIRDGADRAGLSFSLLVGPMTAPARMEQIVKLCTGFVYLLARAGVTGESDAPPDIAAAVARLRDMTDLPVACGFGISTPDHVRAVVAHADAAIVGSALVRRIEDTLSAGADPVTAAAEFVRTLAGGLPAKS